MPATRSRVAADEDATTKLEELVGVSQHGAMTDTAPVANGDESVTGMKSKKKKKAGKKGKKGKKEQTTTDYEDDEKEDNDQPNEPSEANEPPENGDTAKSAEERKLIDNDPFVERPATPTVKKGFIASLLSEETSTTMEDESHKKETVMTQPKTDATTDSKDLKVNESTQPVAQRIDTAVHPHVVAEHKSDHIESTESLKSPIESITSHLTSPTIAAPHHEDAIEAIDALEDALEEVGKILPKVDPLSPVKPRAPVAKKRISPAVSKPKATSTKPATSVPAKKTPVTKPSGSSLLKSTQPSAISRGTGVTTQPAKPKTTTRPKSIASITQLAKSTNREPPATDSDAKPSGHFKRRSIILPPKDTKDRPDYLAAKRRPISMQFPPPPGPIKSNKPATRPTFVLPSEAYEEKRKVARQEREERRKKEEEELQKKREFKARPVPSNVVSGAAVRQTASSIKRMSVVIGSADMQALADGQNVKPGASGVGKRSSVLHGRADSVANSAAKRSSVHVPVGPSGNKRSSIIVPKRQSLMGPTGGLSASTRGSSPGAPVTEQDVAAQKVKAREIYNRDKVEKDAKQKERREKEEAAKRARADAAEKGRQASREWAEKQKRKALAEAAKKKAPLGAIGGSVEVEDLAQTGASITA